MSKKEIKNEKEMLRENRRVQTFFNQLEKSKTFNTEDLKVLREAYDSLKQKVEPSVYSEVAMSLTAALLTRSNRGIEAKGLIGAAIKDPLIAEAMNDENIVSLYGLSDGELLIVSDVAGGTLNEEEYEVDEQAPKYLVKGNAVAKK